MPVAVATRERGFSKLMLLKNYLNSTLERLKYLPILSIEN